MGEAREAGRWPRFYDHANFNGVMSKIRARELGFDACMFMLHKTFGGPKGGGGPAVGAYGCSAELAPFLPKPVVVKTKKGDYRLDYDRKMSVGKVREFLGNLQVVFYAYAWAKAMGGDGITEASDLAVLGNKLHGEEAPRHQRRGEVPSAPDEAPAGDDALRPRPFKEETGVGIVEIGARMTRLRRRQPVAESRALGRARAFHAGSRASSGRRRTSTTGSPRSRRRWRRPAKRPGRIRISCAQRRTMRRSADQGRQARRSRPLGDHLGRMEAQARPQGGEAPKTMAGGIAAGHGAHDLRHRPARGPRACSGWRRARARLPAREARAAAGDTRRPEFLRLNPMGRVPASTIQG